MTTTKQTWRDILSGDRLESEFTDLKPALNDYDAGIEANRCINCYEAPCVHACPTHIDIPRFIGRIANADIAGAAKTILDANILGLSCAHACPTEVLCEGACVHNTLNKKPILIGKLQRHAVEYAYHRDIEFYRPGKSTGKRVALVGAGPASLACAHELRKHGHETVIYEKTHIPGGLNTTGIAPYKMKTDVSLREVDRIAKMGVRFEFGQELGRSIQLNELLNTYDAVFLGLGLGPDSKLSIPGADSPVVRGAVEFIQQLKTQTTPQLGDIRKIKSALVIGGGNTAIDACRELKGLGINQVVVSYRRGETDMSGYAHEFKLARQEGVEFWFHTLPVRMEKSSNDRVRVTLQKTEIAPENMKGGKIDLTDEKLELEVGLVLVATGQNTPQATLESVIAKTPGLRFDRGRLLVDAGGMTGNPKIFAGGDLTNGGMEVVNAVAEGMCAAHGICEVLKNG